MDGLCVPYPALLAPARLCLVVARTDPRISRVFCATLLLSYGPGASNTVGSVLLSGSCVFTSTLEKMGIFNINHKFETVGVVS